MYFYMRHNYIKKVLVIKHNFTYLLYTLFIIFFFITQNSIAQGTACFDATPLTINGACGSGTISNTADDAPTISGCNANFNRDGWYVFTVTGGPLNVTITASISDSRNLYLQLISSSNNACGGTRTQVACANNTNSNGPQTETITSTLANGTYWVKVVNTRNGNTDMILDSICITGVPVCNTPTVTAATSITSTSAIINWTAASPAPSNGYQYVVSTSNTTPTGAGTAGTSGLTVNSLSPSTTYYVFVRSNCGSGNFSPWSGPVSFITPALPSCNPPTVTAATSITSTSAIINWTAASPAPSNGYEYVVSTSNTTPTGAGTAGTSGLTVNSLTPSTTYYVFVRSNCGSGNFSTWSGPVSFTTSPASLPNDFCANATSLTCTTTNLAGTTIGSTDIASGVTGCGLSNYGVWYTFVGDGNQTTITTTGTGGFDQEMSISSGSCGALTNITCQDVGVGNGTESYTFITTNGVNYYVYVAHWLTGSTTTGNFTISRSCVVISPCTTPTQPTALTIGTITDNSIAGSFTGSGADNYLVLMNTTGIAPTAPVNGTTYNIGNTTLGATVIDNDNNTTFTATGLNSSTQYYFYIFAFNNTLCSGGPVYSNISLTGNATTTTCTPTSTNNSEYIDDFSASGDGTFTITNNNTGAGSTTSGYTDFTSLTVSQIEGGSINFTVGMLPTIWTYGFNIWIDLNDDLNFSAGELVYTSGAYITGVTDSFTVPGGSTGTHIMRIRSSEFNISPPSCGNISYGEAEDYTIVISPRNCTADPSNLLANVTSTTTATISWDPATPAPANGYEYIISLDNTTSTPAGDITGTITGTSVNLTGLTANTTYYVFVRGDCGAPDGQGIWIITSFNTGCADIVTTPTACPLIVGEQGVNPFTANPFEPDPSFTIDCTSGSLTLEAHSQLRETTSYVVEKIPYNPPVAYTSFAASSVNITADDVWASSFSNLGFDFCFYGNTYNQCLVGANGAVTFNSTITPGSGSGYSFSNNLPSTVGALFEQTIYGVYHDVDPGASTLDEISTRIVDPTNIGCRKFVIAWHDVPMFSNNSLLYTGMIVLHETTNIIEVFIEEKRIDGTWNGGNALVGIQGDITPLTPNNQYAVAPCRNGLDTNWETFNEAWRFVPNGAVINPTSVTWYEGSGTGGTNLGSGTTLVVNGPNTYTAEVTYPTCNGPVTLTDEVLVVGTGKVWNGSVSTDWHTANNWTPTGVPTSSDCVLIPNNGVQCIISNGFDGDAYSLTIQNGGDLLVSPSGTITVQDLVTVNTGGIFTLDGFEYDTASLIQVNNVSNNGIITMRRDSNIRRQDYVYWSSPVANFPLSSVSPTTPGSLIYEWVPTIDRPDGPPPQNVPNDFGDWINATGTMTNAKGYIIRGPGAFDIITPSWFSATFTGNPNNGDITIGIERGTYTGTPYSYSAGAQVTNEDDNWNLVGNPYPSAIDANVFLALPSNNVIDGTVYLWTHGTRIQSGVGSPFYGDYVYNYNISDYLEYNLSGPSTQNGFDGFIGSGQGFFVLMEEAPTTGINETLTFNNSMRSSSNRNDQFFRTSSDNSNNDLQRDRIWLDLISPTEKTSTTLIAYVEGATYSYDRLFDASTIGGSGKNLYSLLNDEHLVIQGRVSPFEINDQVPIGLLADELGIYTIAIHGVDGLFLDDQNIYIEDLELNIIHDLKNAPYVFTIDDLGNYDERFILRYTDETLGLNEFTNNPDISIIAPKGEYIKINSTNEPIKNVIVYDLLGRVLLNLNDLNINEIILDNLNLSDGAYLVKAELYSTKQKIQKIVLKQ